MRAYEHDLLRFHRFLAQDFLGCEPEAVKPQDVDALAVRSFLAALTREKLGKRSQGRALSAVRSRFRFACREGTLAANPMFSAGLERIGYAAQHIWNKSAQRVLAHATSGPALQQNLVAVMEGR